MAAALNADGTPYPPILYAALTSIEESTATRPHTGARESRPTLRRQPTSREARRHGDPLVRSRNPQHTHTQTRETDRHTDSPHSPQDVLTVTSLTGRASPPLPRPETRAHTHRPHAGNSVLNLGWRRPVRNACALPRRPIPTSCPCKHHVVMLGCRPHAPLPDPTRRHIAYTRPTTRAQYEMPM